MESALLKNEYQAVIRNVEEKLGNNKSWEKDYYEKIANIEMLKLYPIYMLPFIVEELKF